MNMSYCRFENTYGDLEACDAALTEGTELSEREAKYAKKLLKLCQEIVKNYSESDIDLMEEDDTCKHGIEDCEDCE